MKLLIIRHAKSVFNELNLIQGQYDCNLSKDGIKKTKEFRKNFDKPYDYCYSSPLKRAKLTAKIITGNGPIVYDNRLMETCFGEMEKTKITKEKINDYIKGTFIPKGAESRQDVIKRIKLFLEDIKNHHQDTDIILIITHGGVIRAIQHIYKLQSHEVSNLDVLEMNI